MIKKRFGFIPTTKKRQVEIKTPAPARVPAQPNITRPISVPATPAKREVPAAPVRINVPVPQREPVRER